jgi:hypothetical protein
VTGTVCQFLPGIFSVEKTKTIINIEPNIRDENKKIEQIIGIYVWQRKKYVLK